VRSTLAQVPRCPDELRQVIITVYEGFCSASAPRHLAVSRSSIAKTKQRIARQREIVRALSEKGYPTEQATEFLQVITGTLRAYEAIRDRRAGTAPVCSVC